MALFSYRFGSCDTITYNIIKYPVITISSGSNVLYSSNITYLGNVNCSYQNYKLLYVQLCSHTSGIHVVVLVAYVVTLCAKYTLTMCIHVVVLVAPDSFAVSYTMC